MIVLIPLLVLCIISTNLYATDYTISNGTTQTTQAVLTAEDTLTVANGGTLDYDGYYAVNADGITFNAQNTTINNAGTIQTNQNYGIDISDSTNASIVNSGTITNDAANKSYIIYANRAASGSVTNSGTIQPYTGGGTPIYLSRTTNFTVTNNSGGTINGRASTGVSFSRSTSPTVTNNSGGTITTTGDYAVNFSRSSNITLTNGGTISAGDDYTVHIGDTTGNNRITNTGTISASDDSAIYADEANNVTVTNSGTISSGDNYGVNLNSATGTTSVTNNSGATISATDNYAVDFSGAADIDLTNAGTISAGADSAIYLTNSDDFEITNSGSITAGDDYGMFIYGNLDGGEITNSGTIDVVDDYGIYIGTGHTGVLTITNSGTIRSATYPIGYNGANGSGRLTLINSGTIEADDAGYTDNVSNISTNSTITNTGTITGGRYGFTPKSGATGITLTNKTGTINGSTYDVFSYADNWGTFVNGQGGEDCVKYYYYLPTNYEIYIASTTSYGKMCSTAGVYYSQGDTNFSINTASSLSAGTYTDVFTNAEAADFASGTTGTCSCANGSFNWTLSDSNSDNDWDLIVTSNDTTAPTLSSSTPADNATGVAVNANIVLNFSEAVDAESGNITIKKTSDNSTIETIDVTGAKVSGSGGTQITINPGTNWDQKTEYYVLIDATAFDDGNSNSYAGISSTTALSFTTVDSTNPTLSSSSPADNATGVATNNNIVLTFDEEVDPESGNITIKKTSDNTTVETIDVTGNKISGNGSCGGLGGGSCTSGTIITINPGTDWSEQTEYYVLIDASAFDDASSNSYAGISSTTALSFTTGDETNPTLSSSSPADNAENIKVSANIVLTFSEAVDAESGNITIKKTKGDSTVATIDVTGQYVTGSGGTEITINPAKNLSAGIEYYVLIDATAFDDSTGNSYAGISSTTALSFKTKREKIFNEKIKTQIKNQVNSSVKVIASSLNRVSSRMNFVRPKSSNISTQGIDIAMDFQNQYTNEVMEAVYPNMLEASGELFKNWAIWTEGNISYGKIGDTNDNVGQHIHSDGITIGVDKKFKNNKVFGLALNRVWQATEVGNNDASIDTESLTLISYSSLNISKRKYLDTVLGYGEMDIDLIREVTGGQNEGNRKGRQFFGSVKYVLEPKELFSSKDISYYTRADLGYTILEDYSETGNSTTAVHYNKQHIQNGSLSIGFNISGETEINKITTKPFMQFEFGGDATNNSLSEAYYVTDSSTIYTHAMSDKGTKHTQLTMGFEAELKNNKTINVTYDRYDGSENMFMNTLSINFRKRF